MRELLIYDKALADGEAATGYAGAGPLPRVGESVLVRRMDGSGVTYPAHVLSTDREQHTYTVVVTCQLQLW